MSTKILVDGNFLKGCLYRDSIFSICIKTRGRVEKGSGVFSHDPLGRPRGRNVASIPKRFAMRCTHPSSPKGLPRCTLTRSASNSDAVCGRFTRATQSRGGSTGQALSQVVSFGSPCVRRHLLDHCQSSARLTSFARNALRST